MLRRLPAPAVVLACLLAGPLSATAQPTGQPEACNASNSPHQFYRTQDALLVLANGTAAATIWVGIENKGVFMSADDGATWTRRDTGIRGYPRQGSESDRCVREIGRIVADPNDVRHLYLLRVSTPGTLEMSNSELGGIYETTDAGVTWRQLTGYGNAAGGHALAVAPSTSGLIVYMGTNNSESTTNNAPRGFYNTTGVVYRSLNGGAAWAELDQRATGESLIAQYFLATQVYTTANGQRVWVPIYVRSATGAQGPSSAQVGYLESSDGGQTWVRGTERFNDVDARAGLNGDVAPANFDHRLMTSSSSTGQAYSWYTLDGVTWQKTPRYFYVARYSPHDPQGLTIYGYDPFAGDPGSSSQGIYRSTDGGATWTKRGALPSGVDNALNGVRITHFAFHPTDPQTVYATGSGANVWKSTDGAVTWTSLLTLVSPVLGGANTTTPTVPGPPGAPGGTASAATVALSWPVTTTGGLAASYVIQSSTSATFASGVTEIATTTSATSRSITLTSSGRHYLRVIGVNAVGRGTPSAAVAVDVTIPPTMSVSPSALRFAATKAGAGGALTSVTTAQTVTVAFSSGAAAWTAAASQPWVTVTGGAGNGAGSFTAAIANPSNVIGASTTLSAVVTVTAASAANSPLTISVTLTVDQTGGASTAAPIGQVDTPVQGATGVQGAIPVTGWAVDDVGLAHVKVYRTCLTFENQAACQIVGGRNVVYLADAQFVPGARPDVEAAYPNYPASHIAGWGMQVLSNMLPDVTNARPFGGQGTLDLFVFATDLEGKVRLLGRDPSDHTPTTVTMTNGAIAKPFGAIDTPSQGGTTSGQYANFGWVLTPDANTTAEAGDILMTTTGARMTVFIDGAPVGTVTYNHCRGTVGTPVPSGLLCDDDVANIFGQATPQPVFTTRTANTTRFRNLDAARGAIGVFTINTTTLTNGMHNLAWGVTDSANRSEGIGSRNFFVLNSGADPPSPTQTSASARQVPHSAPSSGHPAPSTAHPALSTEHRAQRALGRSGFSLATAFVEIAPDAAGERRVQIGQLDRVELQLGAGVTAGHLVVNGTQRDLPVGSRLDTETGTFTWAPAAGFLGAYRFVFGCQGEACLAQDAVSVTVTIRPATPTPEGESEIRMHLDDPIADGPIADTTRRVTVSGRAFDPQAFTGSGIGAVHVWARRVDVPTVGPEFLGAATLGVERTDASVPSAGFRLTAPLTSGVYDVTVYVWNQRTARWEDARTLRVHVRG